MTSVPAAAKLAAVTLSERVEFAWKRSGLSMRALGREIGKSEEYVQKLISRGAKRPDVAALAGIARVSHVSEAWLLWEKGSPDDAPAEGPRVEREPQPLYSDGEAPILANLPGWPDLVAAAQALDEARGVPSWAFELLGHSNALMTIPLVPAAVVDLAKAVAKYTTPADAEAKLRELRERRG